MKINADEALEHFVHDVAPGGKVIDIGCGGNIKPMLHTPRMRSESLRVDALDMAARQADIHCRFEDYSCPCETYDGVWASHMLEHVTDIGMFLRKCRRILKPGGVFGITVPTIETNFGKLVPGHLSLWNPAILCYNLIMAGWDLRKARLGVYGKNISVVTNRVDANLPNLRSCRGDLQLLREFFPVHIEHGCSVNFPNTRWK